MHVFRAPCLSFFQVDAHLPTTSLWVRLCIHHQHLYAQPTRCMTDCARRGHCQTGKSSCDRCEATRVLPTIKHTGLFIERKGGTERCVRRLIPACCSGVNEACESVCVHLRTEKLVRQIPLFSKGTEWEHEPDLLLIDKDQKYMKHSKAPNKSTAVELFLLGEASTVLQQCPLVDKLHSCSPLNLNYIWAIWTSYSNPCGVW